MIDKEEAAEVFKNVRGPSEAEERLSELVAPLVMAGQQAADENEPPMVEFLSVLLEQSESQSHERKDAKPGGIQAATGGNGAPTDEPVPRKARRRTRSANQKPNPSPNSKSVPTGKNGSLIAG